MAASRKARSPAALSRIAAAGALGALVTIATPVRFDWWVRAVAGWDAAAAGLLLLQWYWISASDAKQTEERAAREDPGRVAAWLLVLASCAFSLFSSLFVIRRAQSFAETDAQLWSILGFLSVALSWALTHTEYTLRYAHLYYRKGAGSGGLEFPGNAAPADLDFAYFAFTIGMCFQVSDVTVSSPTIRRTALAHALIAFAYNTTILALTLNLISGGIGH
jgi:uncharacterized membrane protein